MATRFDAVMESRLIAYQQATGLNPDGKAGQKTWMTFLDTGTAAQVVTEQPEAVRAPDLSCLKQVPLLLDLIENGQDESGVKDFYRRVAGVDLDAILEFVEDMLATPKEATE